MIGIPALTGSTAAASHFLRKGVEYARKDAASRMYGYVSGTSTINDVPSAYTVSIYSSQMRVLVRAVMQENISMNVTGRWEPVIGLGFLSGMLDKLTQYSGGFTLLRPWMTARMWRGTSPISISMNLKFEAVEDADRNVFKACTKLQEMALPYWLRVEKGGEYLGDLLSPPGPSAFRDVPYVSNEEAKGDQITIIIGKMYTFRNVVISDVSTVIEPKFTEAGKPISGSVAIKFETYTIMDRRNFQHATGEREEPYDPKMSKELLLEGAKSAVETMGKGAWGATKAMGRAVIPGI